MLTMEIEASSLCMPSPCVLHPSLNNFIGDFPWVKNIFFKIGPVDIPPSGEEETQEAQPFHGDL